ncbi:MAG: hypothetical protein ACOX6K_01345 [Sphaerochaetaceae bacterium]|jgi:hypothetical protein
MPTRRLVLIAAACAVVALSLLSCSRQEFSLIDTQAVVVVVSDSSDSSSAQVAEALSLFVDLGPSISAEDVQFSVSTPGGGLSWDFTPTAVEFDGVRWLGDANLSLADGGAIPSGSWSLRIFNRDGRTIETTFQVSSAVVDAARFPVLRFGVDESGEEKGTLQTHGDDTETWCVELSDQAGATLFSGEFSQGSYTAQDIGGATIWDEASQLTLYRYIPELHATLVVRRSLR